MNEVAKLKEIFEKNADKIFVTDSKTNQEFSYRDIEGLSLRLASFLEEKGIKKQETIAIILPNCIEFILLYFACMHIGAIPVPINQRLRSREIKHILSNSNAKCIFIWDEKKALLDHIQIEKVFTIKPSNKEPGFIEEIRKCPPLEKAFASITDEDIIIIVYTSGTTKMPKGVVRTYKQVISNGAIFVKTLELSSNLNFFAYMDLAYLGGFYNLMLIPLLAQSSIVLGDTFNPEMALHFWDYIEKYKINALWLVPSIVSILFTLEKDKATPKDHLIKKALIGTAPLTGSLKKRFEDAYKIEVFENYGLSETFFITTNSQNLSKNKGVGKLLPGVEITIRDNNNQKCKEGEIFVKSPFIMNSYYNNEEETKASFVDGWFKTGDIGYLDEDQHLHITGRKKDIIIRGGINISPKEIENVILQNDMINEVAVIGIPNELTGEDIAACINGNISEEEIRKNCQKNLAPFKVPKYFYFVKEFPRSVTGKIQKQKLKEMIKDGTLK